MKWILGPSAGCREEGLREKAVDTDQTKHCLPTRALSWTIGRAAPLWHLIIYKIINKNGP